MAQINLKTVGKGVVAAVLGVEGFEEGKKVFTEHLRNAVQQQLAGTPAEQRSELMIYLFSRCNHDDAEQFLRFQAERKNWLQSGGRFGPLAASRMVKAFQTALERAEALTKSPDGGKTLPENPQALDQLKEVFSAALESQDAVEVFIQAIEEDKLVQLLRYTAAELKKFFSRAWQKGKEVFHDVDHRLSEWTRNEVAYWENGGSPHEPWGLRVFMGMTARRTTRRWLAQEDRRTFTERRRSHA